jgi:hypothetical protein
MGPTRDKQVALSTFSYVFSELVQYQTTKIRSAAELETNLEKMGKDLGKRVLDALFHRDRSTKRELTEVGILKFISTTAWKALWGKEADSLERSNDREDEYMIIDSAPLVNQFVSVPANLGALDCAALMAGVVAGILVRSCVLSILHHAYLSKSLRRRRRRDSAVPKLTTRHPAGRRLLCRQMHGAPAGGGRNCISD